MKTLVRHLAEEFEIKYDGEPRPAPPVIRLQMARGTNRIKFALDRESVEGKHPKYCKQFLIEYDITYSLDEVSAALDTVFSRVTASTTNEHNSYILVISRSEFENSIVRALKSTEW